jgi:ATP-dependent Clp protease ATP-binding subunit ClpA
MSGDIKVTIYFGPISWFNTELGSKSKEYLLDLVHEYDEERRRLVFQVPGQEPPSEPDQRRRPKRVVAESTDYASVQEHAITNFVGLVRAMNPKHLHLHNPPERIHTQLAREMKVEVKHYSYPRVTRETLVQINKDYASHLIGQENVREALLAAMYPLTSATRTKPVVLMFYGPSGVGKTETAHFINGLLGGVLLRKQFSMFHSEKFASYLFGGTHAEASFARDLLDRESGVILIDEFDKANTVFHSAFYQLFDGGQFEDKNYRVDVGPAIIICTSNYGSEGEIREALGDALYSRFDSLVQFTPLTKDEVRRVIDRLVDRRVGDLDASEAQILDVDKIKESLNSVSGSLSNVRKLGKLVDEVISLSLARALINEKLGPWSHTSLASVSILPSH